MKYTLSFLLLCTTSIIVSSDYKTIKYQLFFACENNDIDNLKRQMKKAKKNAIEPLFLKKAGKTLLHYAIQHNAEAICKVLIRKYNFSTHTKTERGKNTPLHLAACKGNRPIVKLLLKHDGFNTEKNKNGKTPIERALLNGHKPIANSILAYAQEHNLINEITLTNARINKILDKSVKNRIVMPSDITYLISKQSNSVPENYFSEQNNLITYL